MKTLKPHPLSEILPMLDGQAYQELLEDIRRNGILHPIALYENAILDGRNRYRAAQELGIDCPMHECVWEDSVAFIISANIKRRHLNESQRAMVADRLATLRHGGFRHGQPANSPGDPATRDEAAQLFDVPNQTRGQQAHGPIDAVTQDEAARMLNVSTRSIKRARVVRESGIPELIAAVEAGTVAVRPAADAAGLTPDQQRAALAKGGSAVKTAAKKAKRDEREQALGGRIKAANAELVALDKRYGVILSDPPWKFKAWSEEGMQKAADNHYPTEDIGGITSQRPPAADDCVLFMWTTGPMLAVSLKLMADWGFAYKSALVWVKDKPGTGYWARETHETLLIGTRGLVPAPAPGSQTMSAIEAPRGLPSVKPLIFHEIIEGMFPSLPKLEMYARAGRPGWDAWGAEAPTEDAA